jgi:hypothetical protein
LTGGGLDEEMEHTDGESASVKLSERLLTDSVMDQRSGWMGNAIRTTTPPRSRNIDVL